MIEDRLVEFNHRDISTIAFAVGKLLGWCAGVERSSSFHGQQALYPTKPTARCESNNATFSVVCFLPSVNPVILSLCREVQPELSGEEDGD